MVVTDETCMLLQLQEWYLFWFFLLLLWMLLFGGWGHISAHIWWWDWALANRTDWVVVAFCRETSRFYTQALVSGSFPSNTCRLGFQVPLLQVLLPRVLPPHPLRLQAALPGAAVHEHHPPAEAVQVQWVRPEAALAYGGRRCAPRRGRQRGLRTLLLQIS